MYRVLTVVFSLLTLGGASALGRPTSIVCAPDTVLHERVENKITISSCSRKIRPCPKHKSIEMIPNTMTTQGACQIPDGKTVYHNQDGSELFLNYDLGKLHGKMVAFSANKKQISEENYFDGLKQGIQKTFFSNGKKKLEENYLAGQKLGEQISRYENGELEGRSYYVDNRPTGVWTSWYSNGNKRDEVTYGILGWEGLYRNWYSQGGLHLAAQYVNGVAEGTYSLYYPNGKKRSERRYVKGLLEGTFDEWSPTGVKEASSEYAHGKFKQWLETPIEPSASEVNLIRKNSAISHCAAFAGIGLSQGMLAGAQSCLKADIDGNGYLDDIVTSPDKPNQTWVVLTKRDQVINEVFVPEPFLEVYSSRSVEGQFQEPATPNDGLVAWGKGKDTTIYLYNFDKVKFEKKSYRSDLDI